MRVLYLNFHRGWGGQPQYILTLATEMAARGHEVALAVPGDGALAERARQAGLAVFGAVRYRPPARAVSFARDALRLRGVLSRWRPDLLHSHGSQDTWAAVAANRWFGGRRAPHVMTRHNTKRVLDNAANRYLYGRALDMLIVVSASVLERYRPFLRRGELATERIAVIHAAVDPSRFAGPLDPQRIRGELGLSEQDMLVGCVGRLVKDKGQIHLLEAAARLAPRRGEVFYALAGTGTEEETLKRAARQWGIQDRVFFLGFRSDMPDITAALDISVLPSVDCDASSTVLKEAMLLGKPVVATDIGGAREIVADGVSGLIVPPGDPAALAGALDRLAASPAEARRMGEEGRRLVSGRFTPARMCEQHMEAYRALLARGGAPASG